MTLRCPGCRTRRASMKSMMAHIAETGHQHCKCGGYWYPHRPASPFCWLNPRAAYNDAARRGESEEVLMDILIDLIFETPGKTSKDNECPF